MSNDITYKSHYKDLPINTGMFKNLGVYTRILKAIHDQIQALLSRHSRITLVLFNLHLPDTEFMTASTSNLHVTRFFKQVKEDLAKTCWGKHQNVIHFWAREVGESEKGHYHCFIGFKQSYKRIGGISSDGYTGMWKTLEERWCALTEGFLRPVTTYTVNRGNKNELDNAFKRLSYAAKVRDKDFGTGDTYKRFSASRLESKDAEMQCAIPYYQGGLQSWVYSMPPAPTYQVGLTQ